jgi:hypothetical protein
MSQEHTPSSPDAVIHDTIQSAQAPFEVGYQLEDLPRISVPDLPEDAQGLSAEALAHVPTLTELVEPAAEVEQVIEPVVDEPVIEAAPIDAVIEQSSAIQDVPVQADTWGEQLQVRMGKLTDDIHTLNARLDRLEERNRTKV